MKKLFILFAMLTVALMGYSQATPVEVLRIAEPTTATLGKNLSTGKLIYCISTDTWYTVIAPAISTLTITTALSGAKIAVTVKPTDIAIGTTTNTTVPITSSTGADIATIPLADATHAGIISGTLFTTIGGLSADAGAMQSEAFEIALSGGGTNKTVTTAFPIKTAASLTVILNGTPLKVTTEYTVVIATGVITIIPLIYDYDAVRVIYAK
jgi:hypothetical protein